MPGFPLFDGIKLITEAPKYIGLAVNLFNLGKRAVETVQQAGTADGDEQAKKSNAVALFRDLYDEADHLGDFTADIDAYVKDDVAEPFVELVYRTLKRFVWKGKQPVPGTDIQLPGFSTQLSSSTTLEAEHGADQP